MSDWYPMTTLADGTRQYVHIVIVEQVLGRKLRYFGPGHPDNEVVHHIDGNKRHNKRRNLLVCTHAYHVALHARLEASEQWPEFKRRTNHPHGCERVGMFGFKGVGYDKEKRRYTAMIRTEGRSKRIGRFKTATEAARAYDRAALALRGPDWVTNQSMGLLP